MNYIYISGFTLGTFKFLFAHWVTYYAALEGDQVLNFFEIFIPTTLGGLSSAALFYFLSDYMMERAAKNRRKKMEKALAAGKEIKPKKKFTRVNKAIIWLKRTFGIYGITCIAPLFFSVPVGSIICAKFYGGKRKTFPLMVLFMSSYSFLMSLLIQFIQ